MTQPAELMTPAQLRDTLVTVIAGVKGEPEAKWHKIVGEIAVLSIVLSPRCNWKVTPIGTKAQITLVEQCVDIVKAEHPYVG